MIKIRKQKSFKKRKTLKEFYGCIGDLLADSKVKRLNKYIKHGSTPRLKHCISVGYTSYKIARRFKSIDEVLVARSGLLHDCYYGDVKLERHTFIHPEKAIENASQVTNLCDKMKNIILSHMFPLSKHLPRSKEAWLIVIVDKYCACKECFIHLGKGVKLFAIYCSHIGIV